MVPSLLGDRNQGFDLIWYLAISCFRAPSLPGTLAKGISGNPRGSTAEDIRMSRHLPIVMVVGLVVPTVFGQESDHEDQLPSPSGHAFNA
jgi:hypothetical protein